MLQPSIRRIAVTCVAAAMVLSSPSESHAICAWLRNLCPFRCCLCQPAPPPPPPVYVAPPPCNPCAAPVYDPCAQPVASPCGTPACQPGGVIASPPVVTQYMPQTCYRTQNVNVPVTTYQPVRTGGCGCGSTTAYRPVTTFQTQARHIPYTSYRIVYRQPSLSASPAVSAYYRAPAATYYSSTPAYSSSTPVYSGASPYSSSTVAPPPTASAPSSMVPPSLPPAGAASGIPSGQPGTAAPYGTRRPMTSPDKNGTHKDAGKDNKADESAPNDGTNGSQNGHQSNGASDSDSGPQLGTPTNSREKMAAQKGIYRTVFTPDTDRAALTARLDHNRQAPSQTPAAATKQVDDGGWRPSSR